MKQTLTEEEERVNRAKQVAQEFINTIEAQISRHMEVLEKLKEMNLSTPPRHAYDYEEEADRDTTPEQVAREIEHNLEKAIGAELGSPAPKQDDAKPPPLPVTHGSWTVHPKFVDLQFGRNYDPTKKPE